MPKWKFNRFMGTAVLSSVLLSTSFASLATAQTTSATTPQKITIFGVTLGQLLSEIPECALNPHIKKKLPRSILTYSAAKPERTCYKEMNQFDDGRVLDIHMVYTDEDRSPLLDQTVFLKAMDGIIQSISTQIKIPPGENFLDIVAAKFGSDYKQYEKGHAIWDNDRIWAVLSPTAISLSTREFRHYVLNSENRARARKYRF